MTAPDGSKMLLNSEHIRGEGIWYFVEAEGRPEWAKDLDLTHRRRTVVVNRIIRAFEKS